MVLQIQNGGYNFEGHPASQVATSSPTSSRLGPGRLASAGGDRFLRQALLSPAPRWWPLWGVAKGGTSSSESQKRTGVFTMVLGGRRGPKSGPQPCRQNRQHYLSQNLTKGYREAETHVRSTRALKDSVGGRRWFLSRERRKKCLRAMEKRGYKRPGNEGRESRLRSQ